MITSFFDLFSGIGGFALGAYWAGLCFDNHYFSENDPYLVELYKKRFPSAESLGDVKNVVYSELPKGEWLVTGGFPCQPHSIAGKRRGSKDERDLWPECRRMLRDLRPKIALFENVPGLFVSDGGRFFNRILSDISENGYACEWQIISAQDVGAPHLRKRVWIVAYPNDERLQRRDGGSLSKCSGQWTIGEGGTFMANSQSERFHPRGVESAGQPGKVCACGSGRTLAYAESNLYEWCRQKGTGRPESSNGGWWEVEPDVGRVTHGIPGRVDRLKGLGNAIVPQCAINIFNLPAFNSFRPKSEVNN